MRFRWVSMRSTTRASLLLSGRNTAAGSEMGRALHPVELDEVEAVPDRNLDVVAHFAL